MEAVFGFHRELWPFLRRLMPAEIVVRSGAFGMSRSPDLGNIERVRLFIMASGVRVS